MILHVEQKSNKSVSVRLCLFLHKVCSSVLGSNFGTADPCIWNYIEAQYSWGRQTLETFADYAHLEGKYVLDGGCGPGGRTMYYASNGAKEVLGIDIYKPDLDCASEAAKKRGLDNVSFKQASLSEIPLEDETVDLMFMNDVIEHIGTDILDEVLSECKRVLKPGGRLCVEFPPWTGAFAGHLMSYIKLPWVHLLFSEETIKQTLYQIDGEGRVSHEHCLKEYKSLNRLDSKGFKHRIEMLNFKIVNYNERAIRNLKFLKRLPFLGKNMISRVEVVLTR